jgi:hypothetical protein
VILCDIVVLYVLLYCYDDYNDNDGSVSISNMISSIQSYHHTIISYHNISYHII